MGVTGDDTVEWHHWVNEYEFEQTSGDSEGQGSMACCSSWGCKELDMTYFLNNNNNSFLRLFFIHIIPKSSLEFPVLYSQFSSVQSLCHVRLFVTPWITARQASLSITNSHSSLRLTSIESVMPSSHLILCRPLLLLPPIPPSIRVFSNEWKTLYTSIANNQYQCYPLTKDILSNRIWLVRLSSRQF